MSDPNHSDSGRWHRRGYLPHYDPEHHLQSVTFRLADSIPRHALERCVDEMNRLPDGNLRYRRRLEQVMDSGLGECWLGKAEVAGLMQEQLLLGHGSAYDLHAWVIMPNHVHVLYRPAEGQTLGSVVGRWKSCVAHDVNRRFGRSGALWMRECWDRFIRDEEHYYRVKAYIHDNPVKARLVVRPEDWPWSSASS